MQEEQTYGDVFVKHLTALSRQTSFRDKDLQQINAMTREDLAERLKAECQQFSQIVLSNTAEDAAALLHKRRNELASASAGSAAVDGSASRIEILVQLFAVSH